MMGAYDLVESAEPAVLAAIADLQDEDSDSARYLTAARAESTRESYAYDWRVFAEWLEDAYGSTLPEPDSSGRVVLAEPVHPALVIRFLTDLAGHRRASTLGRYLAGIRHHHRANGLASPTDHPQVSQVLAGIQREHGTRPKQARPLYLADLHAAVDQLDDTMKGLRNRALLLVGWWGALRASELVGLDVGDVETHPEGLVLTLPRSKTDQAGEGREVPIHYRDKFCPVLALRSWLQQAELSEGPVLQRLTRHGSLRRGRIDRRWVVEIVKDAAASIGLERKFYSAHSLRAGFVSECDRQGVPPGAVRAVTGHKTESMLSLYSRPAQLFKDSAGAFFDNSTAPYVGRG